MFYATKRKKRKVPIFVRSMDYVLYSANIAPSNFFCDRYAFAIKIQENQRIRKKRTSLTEKKRGRIQRKNESCSVINFVFRIVGPKKKKHSANTRRFQDECDEEKENAAECKLLVVISLIYLE